MKIMVVGGGGREHAIIKKLKENQSVSEIFALPGNGGMAEDATLVPIGAKDKILARTMLMAASNALYAMVRVAINCFCFFCCNIKKTSYMWATVFPPGKTQQKTHGKHHGSSTRIYRGRGQQNTADHSPDRVSLLHKGR